MYKKCTQSCQKNLDEYDKILSQIYPPPKYHLWCEEFSPEELRCIKRLKITHININIFDLDRTISEYVEALEANHQQPSILMDEGYASDIMPSDLRLLFRFHIPALHTDKLNLNKDTADELVDMIVEKHTQSPIGKFNISGHQMRRHFQHVHLDKFKAAGLLTDPDLTRTRGIR